MANNYGEKNGETNGNKPMSTAMLEEDNPEVKTLNPTIKTSKPTFNIECDEILHQLGGFGYWQWLNCGLLCLPSFVAGLIILTYSFTGKSNN